MQTKIEKIFFDFKIIAFELVALNIPFTEREYLSLHVNVLTKNLKISDTTNTEIFELILFQIDQKTWQKYCGGHLYSFSDPLTCWLSISILTWVFLGF